MPKSFFDRWSKRQKDAEQLKPDTKKAPPCAAEKKGLAVPNKERCSAPPKYMRIYDDTDTCRLLGLRKRIVVAARTEKTRGQDWAIEGEHAGMSEDWILNKNPAAKIDSVQPILPGDGITTVRIIGRSTNGQIMIAQKVSDGERVMVRVRDSSMHFVGDQMDTRRIGHMLQFMQELNPENY